MFLFLQPQSNKHRDTETLDQTCSLSSQRENIRALGTQNQVYFTEPQRTSQNLTEPQRHFTVQSEQSDHFQFIPFVIMGPLFLSKGVEVILSRKYIYIYVYLHN